MSDELTLPHYLGIGAVKAGTTWLHRNLYEHPELYLPIQKPLYYWDRHRDRSIESYARLFAAGKDQRCGEFTAAYSVLPEQTIADIHELIPELKLILLLREPRSRAWSEARMELTLIQEREPGTLTPADYCEFMNSVKCRERGDYVEIIRRWSACFPRKQIFVGLYDDIKTDPQKILTSIFAFLGVATEVDWDSFPFSTRIFAGPHIEIPPECDTLLKEMYTRREVDGFAEASGLDLANAWGYE